MSPHGIPSIVPVIVSYRSEIGEDMMTIGRSLAGASATHNLRVGVISLPGARVIGVGVGVAGRSLVSEHPFTVPTSALTVAQPQRGSSYESYRRISSFRGAMSYFVRNDYHTRPRVVSVSPYIGNGWRHLTRL
jgi:hypothetical protein